MNASAGVVLNRFMSLLLTLALLGAPLAQARSGPKEQVAAATAKWGELFVDDNPDVIMPSTARMPCCGARFHLRSGTPQS